MEIVKVSAIFDEFRLKDVEKALIHHGVSGFTLHSVRGRGRYFDSFNEGNLVKHIQMEVYINANEADAVAQVIIKAAYINADSEGLVSIVPVRDLYFIHDKRKVVDKDFHYHEVNDE